jgi:hypothetical protein
MESKPDWLPELVVIGDYQGNWEKYLEGVYEYFRKDFVDDRPNFNGVRLGLKRYPMIEGKEATFWHLISEGKYETDRLPDLRRCERIRWPRPIIETHEKEPILKTWKNKRDGEQRICLWLSFGNEDYLVVLAKRENYLLLWTAYPIIYTHTRRKLQKEYEAFKAGAALN